MRVQTVIASVFLGVGIATAAETCDNSYSEKDCNWEGTAPFCGASDHPVGYTDNGWTLVATTKYEDHLALELTGKISLECYEIYGSGCVTGWKNLWCPRMSF
ncbi:hypothetical protein BO83DRAFT_394523 [Aspergillus eucalypticola CBS 122712]|uniref:Uncharacterized protein n=1 Tax=Aspergillus eucalypticola (strain CBS 122712 / IBT 29274) TaxID=1448314 RepID=A0A317UMU9_ASPEC|nr:uncharacterized protein BO83DRAFT_28535 [Aspergillus eucalypticola CBS 122712]XP_025381793.1 uncharacterized protein BO83DRAFT_211512 [Aspergillus eucalypticola CBS 122712]XP_025381795.1 uncharacterized protein BO83DRAFT_394523 [Aspergillus eucalypticola CBS 122712]PWY61430.1 hypothetical protein BO83DRAFT_28535 [Aspergillus eucalypticola CBS 122712]PWY61723.1 hypothetical protein BO83DRAFT_211512 [Aspergillus eucalypticola CBS 122712]PWY61725.1 hypothetical protein BO83DRAFT_394523 [Asperg